MVSQKELYRIAVKYVADVTPARQIIWEPSGTSTGKWTESLQFRPSVLDSMVLEHCPKVHMYKDAVLAATGWNIEMYYGFQQIMLVGRLIEDESMYRTGLQYWKGIIDGLFFIEMYKADYNRRINEQSNSIS